MSEDMSEDMQKKVFGDRPTRGACRDPALMNGKNAALIHGRCGGRAQSTKGGAAGTETKRDAVGNRPIGPVAAVGSRRESRRLYGMLTPISGHLRAFSFQALSLALRPRLECLRFVRGLLRE